MMQTTSHITVCICTFKRPALLKRLLEELDRQKTRGLFTFSFVVADNDHAQSARQVVSSFSMRSSVKTVYCPEPKQNIARARNRAVANAEGDFIAFIDDDEYPSESWLHSLYTTCVKRTADGVLGPVLPEFEQEPPAWAVRGRFFERPVHETGYRIGLAEARTGNVLFRRNILEGMGEPFRTEFGTGGEDVDFFRRMMDKGFVFIWCNEAAVHETVPPDRCTRRYLLKRALLRGGNSIKHRAGRFRSIVKSLVALPLYGLSLPLLLVAGDHHFLKYLIKFCDHAGKLLGLVGLHPVKQRTM